TIGHRLRGAESRPVHVGRNGAAVYAGGSEEIVSRKPLGSVTSNARVFQSVSYGCAASVMPALVARLASSSTFCGVDMNNRMPMPFLRSRPFFQSSWL